MTALGADFDFDLTPAQGDGILLQVPVAVPERGPPDWASLLKETEARVDGERARANVAELLRDELRLSEREARSCVSSLRRQLDTCRSRHRLAAPKILTGTVKALKRRVRSQDDGIDWLKRDMDKVRLRTAKVFQEGGRVAESVRRQFGAARCQAGARELSISYT